MNRNERGPKTRRWAVAGVVGVLVGSGLSVAAAAPAEAAPAVRYVVSDKTSVKNVTGPTIAKCKIYTKGGTCTITSGKSVTRTVQLSLGAKRGEVTAGLNISAASMVTTSVACTSPRLKAGQIWRARGIGTQYRYKLKKQEGSHPRIGGPMHWHTVSTSGYLTAFNPYRTAIACGIG